MSSVGFFYLVGCFLFYLWLLREFGKGCRLQPVDFVVEACLALFWPLWVGLLLVSKLIGDEPYIPEYEDYRGD